MTLPKSFRTDRITGWHLAIASALGLLGVAATTEVVVASSIASGIESYNQRAEFDLVVMGSSSQNPSRLLRGVIATLRNRVAVPLLFQNFALP